MHVIIVVLICTRKLSLLAKGDVRGVSAAAFMHGTAHVRHAVPLVLVGRWVEHCLLEDTRARNDNVHFKLQFHTVMLRIPMYPRSAAFLWMVRAPVTACGSGMSE